MGSVVPRPDLGRSGRDACTLRWRGMVKSRGGSEAVRHRPSARCEWAACGSPAFQARYVVDPGARRCAAAAGQRRGAGWDWFAARLGRGSGLGERGDGGVGDRRDGLGRVGDGQGGGVGEGVPPDLVRVGRFAVGGRVGGV